MQQKKSKKKKENNMGKIHSLETFGTVDGPGVRFVVFFQGCPMRCQYCHNPDTWKIEDGEEMTADEIIDRFERNRSFYQTGGITATGGEPMLQLDFLTELFTKAKAKGIHTCLDTSGIMFPKKHIGTEQISEREISLTGISESMASDRTEYGCTLQVRDSRADGRKQEEDSRRRKDGHSR